MSKFVKVGDKIRMLIDNFAGTNEKAGTFLTVVSIGDEYFRTNFSNTTVEEALSDEFSWVFVDLNFNEGGIELVKEEFDTPLPDDLIKALSPRGPSVDFSEFEQQRLSYFAKEATKYNYVRLGPGDKDTFDKILKLIKE